MAQAKNAPPPTEAPEEAPKPKKKGKLLVIILAVAVLLALAGGYYFLVVKKQQDAKAAPKAEKQVEEKAPIFTRLEQFTVNLQKVDGEDHYLQVEMDLQVAEDKVVDSIKVRMPQIRNAMLLLLSSKSPEELASVEGKQKLSADIVAQINKIIGATEPKAGVLGVYFSSFVIQ